LLLVWSGLAGGERSAVVEDVGETSRDFGAVCVVRQHCQVCIVVAIVPTAVRGDPTFLIGGATRLAGVGISAHCSPFLIKPGWGRCGRGGRIIESDTVTNYHVVIP
jgi:hypothetical protein